MLYHKILSGPEILSILTDLQRRARRSTNSRQNLTLFRLGTCCGLRISEISKLRLQDVVLTTRPVLHIHRSKRGKSRVVPLTTDRATCHDLAVWKDYRQTVMGAKPGDSFLCNLRERGKAGRPLAIRSLQYRWRTIIGHVLPPERAAQLPTHAGRHSYATHLLRSGKDLVVVRDYLGHSDISVTSQYLHVLHNDEEMQDIFDFSPAGIS